jgi:hypothetical protein
MGVLRDRMIEEMKLRNFSPAVLETLPAFHLALPQPGQERPVKPRGSLAHFPFGEEQSRA